MDNFVLNEGNTAWVLVSAALVLMMTPALAVFYGGMVRSKSVLNIMMMCFSAIGVVAIVYALWGYSMSFGPDTAGGLIGNPFELFGIEGLADNDPSNVLASAGVPIYAWIALQVTFAIITLALLSGAVADRTRFSSWLVLVVLEKLLDFEEPRSLGEGREQRSSGHGNAEDLEQLQAEDHLEPGVQLDPRNLGSAVGERAHIASDLIAGVRPFTQQVDHRLEEQRVDVPKPFGEHQAARLFIVVLLQCTNQVRRLDPVGHR